MTKLKLNLIRHGEKRLFLPDPGLTDLGQEQAEKLAEQLLSKQQAIGEKQTIGKKHTSCKKTLILTSPKKRTRETAAIIAKKLKLAVQVDDFLNIDNVMPHTPANKNKIIEHFKKYLSEIENHSLDLLEIFALTHSQEVRNFWRILGGPEQAVKDVYECGMWTIKVDGEKIDFEWTEGELNP